MLNTTLTPEQQIVADFKTGVALVLAPAGSGKSTTMLERAKNLIQSNKGACNPGDILVSSFSRKSITDLESKVARMGQGAPSGICLSTLHSLGLNIVNTGMLQARQRVLSTLIDLHLPDLPEPRKNTILRTKYKRFSYANGWLLANEIANKFNLTKVTPKFALYLLSQIKKDNINLSDTARLKETMSEAYNIDPFTQTQLLTFILEYTVARLIKGALDFDDMIYLALPLQREFKTHFKYVMLDEAQDSNTIQYLLIKGFLHPHSNLVLIGDDWQSIYGFTGAIPEKVIYQFKQQFPEGQVFKLKDNFRSLKPVVDLSLQIAFRLKNPYQKEVHSVRGNEKVSDLSLTKFDTPMDESEAIINQIKNSSSSLSEIAIIYRINAQSRVFEDQLLKAKIPYIIHGGVSFFNRKDVKDIVALALTYWNPDYSDKALIRTLNIPTPQYMEETQAASRCIGKAFEGILNNNQSDSSRYPSLYQYVTTAKEYNFKRYFKGIEDIKRIEGYSMTHRQEFTSISNLITFVTDNIYKPFKTKLSSLDEVLPDDSIETVKEELISIAKEYAQDKDYSAFIQYLSNAQQQLEAIQEQDDFEGVNLMTYHKSKGLEFETVFLPAINHGTMPFIYLQKTNLLPPLELNSNTDKASDSTNAVPPMDGSTELSLSQDNTNYEDERRLLYVGVTRAKDNVHISHTHLDRKGINQRQESEFITKDLTSLNTD